MTDLHPKLDMSRRIALVTGGTRGLGHVIATTLLAAGSDVLVCARNEVRSLPSAHGRFASFHACDIRDPESARGAVAACVDTYGGLDLVVNNAGGAPPADSSAASTNFTRRILDLNLVAPLTISQAARPHMQERGGTIINISSVSAVRANPLGAAYGAAKAGLESITRTLAHEWGPQIRVVALRVGQVLIEENREFYGDDGAMDRIAAVLAARRLGDPQEVADAVLFAASDLASFVTGTAIEVHGGGEGPAYLLASTGDVSGVKR